MFFYLLNYIKKVLHCNLIGKYSILSVTLTTKLGPSELKLISDPTKLSFIDLNAGSIFMEQQKW